MCKFIYNCIKAYRNGIDRPCVQYYNQSLIEIDVLYYNQGSRRDWNKEQSRKLSNACAEKTHNASTRNSERLHYPLDWAIYDKL